MDSSDKLREPSEILKPDARTKHLVRLDSNSQSFRSITLADQHEEIFRFALNPTVPEEIAIHFETAKNIYIYAWFVFRFYPVAEQQALASLEFALRQRLDHFVQNHSKKHPKAGMPGLAKLLFYAKQLGLIQNEALIGKNKWALEAAKARYWAQQMREIIAADVNELMVDDSHVIATEADLAHDWLNDFITVIPKIRNDYAHGTNTLHHSVLHTFDVVSQLINQLYPE